MIVERKRKNEMVETKFSGGKQLVRTQGIKTTVYDLADEVTFRSGGQRQTITVTPANRTWAFGIGGTASIRG